MSKKKKKDHFQKFDSRQDCKTTCFLATHIKGMILHTENKDFFFFVLFFKYFICKELVKNRLASIQ